VQRGAEGGSGVAAAHPQAAPSPGSDGLALQVVLLGVVRWRRPGPYPVRLYNERQGRIRGVAMSGTVGDG
jgi:hypothetical protein